MVCGRCWAEASARPVATGPSLRCLWGRGVAGLAACSPYPRPSHRTSSFDGPGQGCGRGSLGRPGGASQGPQRGRPGPGEGPPLGHPPSPRAGQGQGWEQNVQKSSLGCSEPILCAQASVFPAAEWGRGAVC